LRLEDAGRLARRTGQAGQLLGGEEGDDDDEDDRELAQSEHGSVPLVGRYRTAAGWRRAGLRQPRGRPGARRIYSNVEKLTVSAHLYDVRRVDGKRRKGDRPCRTTGSVPGGGDRASSRRWCCRPCGRRTARRRR